MEPRTSLPAGKGATDLASVMAALEDRCVGADGPDGRRVVRARRRGALTLVMMALLVAGVIELFTLTPDLRPAVDGGSRASVVFSHAQSGTCLNWPPDAPDKPSFVQCRSDHVFEVAKPVGMKSFGEPCQLAVREYLGMRYDPSSRFTISVLWAGDAGGADGGNLLCGLQLLGPNGKPTPFKGRIADLDQSKVWPAGTCLGIDASNRSTDIPVDCTAPHTLEVTGAVGLAERFPGARPSDADQRAFINETCTRTADAYLAPATLAQSGLSLGYETLSPTSWAAGSRQVSCSIGRPAAQGWTVANSSARNLSPADLPPPAAPPAPIPVVAPPAPAPPPVYEEPLIPVPTEVPPSPEPPAATPTTTETAAPTTTATAPATTPAPEPTLGPAPGPANPPSENTGPPPGIIELPGLPAITLPGYVPPEPEAPPPAN